MMTSEETCRLLMPFADALVAVYHIHGGACGDTAVDIGENFRSVFDALEQVTQTEIGVHAKLCKRGAMGFEDRGEEGFDRMTENDWVRDLHHRRFHMQREQSALGSRAFNFCS